MKRLLILLSLIAIPAFAAELGDDGLHKTDWMRDTFKDLNEDLSEANAEGKRLVLMVEQRGTSIAPRCMKTCSRVRLSRATFGRTSLWSRSTCMATRKSRTLTAKC